MTRLQRAASVALNIVVTRREVFWSAFAAGLTAPSFLYAQPPAYTAMIRDFSVPGSFAQVGALLSASAREEA